MNVKILEEPPSALAEYASVPIAFTVSEVLEVVQIDGGLGGIQLMPRPLAVPYVKDYDRDPENHPTHWPSRFDLTRWGILTAWVQGARVGGAVLAWDTPELDLLEGRRDLAVLWDLRVAPESRGRGIGAVLFRAAEQWAAARGIGWLKIETQNVNVAACRFYQSRGCILGGINRFAYPMLPEETQLLWYKRPSEIPHGE
jgi:GNAT superfamily N-acetyltransferase